MGNCCGSPSGMDNSQPTYRPSRATVGPGYTLGGTGDNSDQVDARTAAALAAEVCPMIFSFSFFRLVLYHCELLTAKQRIQATGKGGKLANQLAADRSKSRQEHLKAAALESRQSQQADLQWD
jgi:hypothetical protein